jgi:glutathione synthase/RimK-type ligase-like ATP-grasp enzyme
MKRTIVNIFAQSPSIPLDDQTFMIGRNLVKKWKIPVNQPITLRFGSLTLNGKAVEVQGLDGIRLSSSVLEKLGVHQGTALCLKYKSSTQTLLLGPLIGVMISRVHDGHTERLFGSITSFCKELHQACEQSGAFIYFFTLDDIHASASRLKGWTYNNSWKSRHFPIPNVIYNRLTSRKYENMPKVQQFLEHVKTQYNTDIFNEKYLNKNEVFDALKKDAQLQSYLPESYLFKNYQMLKTMSSRHSILFLKPVTGSLGKGIIRIKREDSGVYSCSFSSLSGTRKQTFSRLSKLFNRISGKLKTQNYQIQQGIHLATVHRKPLDFRALVQRDSQGEWSITSVVARVAKEQHFVSNVAQGGSLSKVSEALERSSLSPGLRAELPVKMRRAALDIAKGIETFIPAHFAELGVDLAVDQWGKIWLLEVNSKPSKNDNTPLDGTVRIRPSVRKTIQYARFLAKF